MPPKKQLTPEQQYAALAKEVQRLQKIAQAAQAKLQRGLEQNRRENARARAAAARRAEKNQAEREALLAQERRLRLESEARARNAEREAMNERDKRRNFETRITGAKSAINQNVLSRLQGVNASSLAFQEWMRDIFTRRPMPSLLRDMVLPPRVTAYQQLEQISSDSPDIEDPCSMAPEPGRSGIQAHQAVVSVMAQLRAADKIDTSGLLVMHSTGAGKTVIGLSVLLAFWNKTYVKNGVRVPVPVFFVSTNDNQVSNDVLRLAEYALLYFPKFEASDNGRTYLPFARPEGYRGNGPYWRDPVVIRAAADAITARLKTGLAGVFTKDFGQRSSRVLYTYATLGIDLRAQRLPVSMSNAVFVVDEIQYLISPPPTEAMYAPDYKMVWQVLARERKPGSTWVVGMTATPGETKAELVAIMNAVMGPVKNRMTESDSVAQLRSKAAGHVSYAFLLGDRSRFARVNLKLMCSYLSNSYYHDPFFRRLYAEFHQYPEFQKGAEFIKKSIINNRSFGEIWPNLNKMMARKTAETVQKNTNSAVWKYDPDKPDSYLKSLRRLTLFIELRAKYEMDHLERRLNPEHENYVKYGPNTPFQLEHPWLIQELLFSPKGASAAKKKQNNQNNNANNGNNNGNTNVHRVNQALLDRQMQLAEAAGQRRSSRVAALAQRAVASAVAAPRQGASSRRVAPTGGGYFRFLLSPKIPQLLRFIFKDITSAPGSAVRGIHFVYTSDRRAALLLAKTLESVLKMPQLKRAKDVNATKKPYFVMIDRVKSDVRILEPYLTQKSEIRGRGDGLLNLISSDDNYRGDIIKVVIATDKSFKGVDLRNIRYLHLLDPFVNFRDFIQFVGRGPRNCSHAKFKPRDRQVDVLLYRLVYSRAHQCQTADKALPDCFVWSQSFDRYVSPEGFKTLEDEVLWKSSVDYLLFRDNLHRSRDGLMTMIRNTKMCEDDPSAPTGFQTLAKNAYSHQLKFIRQRLKDEHGITAVRKLKMKSFRNAKRDFNTKYKEAAPHMFKTDLYHRNLEATLNHYDLLDEYRSHTYAENLKVLRNRLKSIQRGLDARPNDAGLLRNKTNAEKAIRDLRAMHAEEARIKNYKDAERKERMNLRKRGIDVTTNNIRNDLKRKRESSPA
jgi:hypothetical protein